MYAQRGSDIRLTRDRLIMLEVYSKIFRVAPSCD